MSANQARRIENANFDKVVYYIDKMLSESARYCRCNRCRQDAAALALNTLPPHYYITTSQTNGDELGSPWVLIEVAAREALEKVSLTPHHSTAADGPDTLQDDFLPEEGSAAM